jgi:hypothetical protein
VTDYWFARYRPSPLPQNQSRGLVPISWQGRAAIAAFVLGLVLGGGGMLFFGLRDQIQIGIPLFIACAIAGGSFFLWASVAKSDPVKSVADYRAERAK